jgi:multidrug efflux pump subunit AcrB
LGPVRVGEFNSFGRTWPVMVEIEGQPHDRVESIKQIEVRDAQGGMVPLSRLATLSVREEEATLDRLDMYPMTEITANPASGEPIEKIRALCETTAEEVRIELGLSAGCRLVWLEELPAPR